MLTVCAILAALAAGCGGSDDAKPLIAASKTGVVRGELTPNVHLFGEPVVARVSVVVNRAKADPRSVEVETKFDPYEAVGETKVTREDIGDLTRLEYATTLRCLREDCIPRTFRGEVTVSQLPGTPPFIPGQQRDEKRSYAFPPAVVTVEDAAGKETTLGRVTWPPLRSLSRVNWNDSDVVGQGFPFVATVTPLPDPGYRISPSVLGLALLAIALALLALPAWLLWDRYRRGRAATRRDDRETLSPLERALALVEWASGRPSTTERREALEALAFELESDARAATAREQGWSPPAPEPEEMTELVTEIRESDAPAT